MKIEPDYKIQPINSVYQVQNNNQKNPQQPTPNYKKRNQPTTYKETHAIDFLT